MTKFYAVRVGKVPGVYLSLEACMAQTRGFPFAAFKRFKSIEDAWEFISLPPSQTPSEHPTTSIGSKDGESSSGNPKPKLEQLESPIDVDSLPDTDPFWFNEVYQLGNSIGADNPIDIDSLPDPSDRSSIVSAKELDIVEPELGNPKRKLEQDGADIIDFDSQSSPITSSGRSSAVSAKESGVVEPTEEPNRKKPRMDDPPTNPNNDIPQLDSPSKAFFTSLKYTNPTALTNLAQIGFGAHELLSMRGLPPSSVSSRFRNLLGRNKRQLAAQIESLAFVVARAKEDVWEELEKQLQLL